jgi:hypothetical protein
MTTATLNPRYEITNTSATSGVSTMKQICSTVISEGGYTPSTKIGYVTNNTTVTRVASANTITALCSIRLNPAYPDAVVVPAQLDLLLIDVRYGQFQLIEIENNQVNRRVLTLINQWLRGLLKFEYRCVGYWQETLLNLLNSKSYHLYNVQ